MNAPKVYLQWDDIYSGVERMLKHCPGPGIVRVIGVARGGLIPAVLLAHRLNVRRVESINIYARNRDGSALDVPVVQGFPPPDNEPRTVVVEDIVDTGRTLKVLRQVYPDLPILALVSRRPEVKGMLDVAPDAWVVFPWESD